MIRALLVVAVSVLPGCMGGGCSTPNPQSDTCDDVPDIAPVVDRIDLGYITFGRFELIEPDAAVPLVSGDQGSDMIVAALRITGSGLSSCIAQRTEISVDGEPMVSESSPMRATQLSPAVWQTGSILLPWYGPSGQYGTLTATVANETATVSFWIGYQEIVDATIDAAIPPDAWVPDDAPNDAPIPIDAVPLDAPTDAP